MNIEEVAKLYYPPVLFQLNTLIACNKIIGRKMESNNKACKLMEEAYEEYRRRAIRRVMSNNWLKLHGHPMRRRGH